MNKPVYKIITESWPNIEKQPSSPSLVRALFSLYSGRNSETTLMMQYLYQAMVLHEQGNIALSDIFDAMSNDQIQHIRQIGKLICRHGGEPRFLSYIGGRGIPWSAGSIYYEKNPYKMTEKSLLLENQVLMQYKTILTSNNLCEQAQKLIKRIIKDTENHINTLKHISNNL